MQEKLISLSGKILNLSENDSKQIIGSLQLTL